MILDSPGQILGQGWSSRSPRLDIVNLVEDGPPGSSGEKEVWRLLLNVLASHEIYVALFHRHHRY